MFGVKYIGAARTEELSHGAWILMRFTNPPIALEISMDGENKEVLCDVVCVKVGGTSSGLPFSIWTSPIT